jgi:chaperonin GroEL (HSP60 family)
MELESGAVLQVVGNFTVFSTLAVKKLCIYFFPGASLRSLLGPERSAKMCIFESEEEESGGKGLIVTDSMQVLSALIDQIQHPAGHVIHEAALGHHGNHGCGVTSLVCLAASWSQQVAELRKQGYPLPVVFAVFEECLRESEAAILNLCQPLTKMRDEYSRRRGGDGVERNVSFYSRHSIRPSRPSREGHTDSGFLQYLGKQLCHGREQAMSLAVKAVLPLTKSLSSSPLDLRYTYFFMVHNFAM